MDALKLKTSEPATGENLIKLANTIDQFEQYTRPHASQLARLAEALAIRIGLSAADLNSIKLAALLHDIGELAIDIAGVRQAGPLDFKQRIELWRHPIVSEQQLAKRGLSRQAQLLVRWHHEWWNGTGYPDMLSGEAIPIGARILRLVDSYDALTAQRPYREAYREEQAIEIIAAAAGIEFDPLLVKVFFQMLAEMAAAAQEAAHNANLAAEASAVVTPAEIAVDEQTPVAEATLTTPATLPVISSTGEQTLPPLETADAAVDETVHSQPGVDTIEGTDAVEIVEVDSSVATDSSISSNPTDETDQSAMPATEVSTETIIATDEAIVAAAPEADVRLDTQVTSEPVTELSSIEPMIEPVSDPVHQAEHEVVDEAEVVTPRPEDQK